MIALIERPEYYCYTGNPIRYRLQVSNPEAAGCEVQVRLYVGNTNDALDDLLAMTIPLMPPASGIVDVYLEDLIDSYLKWQMPNPARGAVTIVTQQLKSFFIEYRQVTAASSSDAWKTDLSNRRLAMKGGYPALINNRSTPAGRSSGAMSYQSDLRVGVDDHFFKSFFLFQSYTPDSMEAELTVYYDTGLTATRTIAFPAADGGGFNNVLYHLPAGLYTWNPALVSDDIIIYYEIKILITDPVGTAAVTLLKCIIDHNPHYEVVAFNYHNSLGGMDYMRLLGDTDIETERTFTEGESIITANYNQQVKDWQFFQRNMTLQTTFKGDAGFFISPEEQAIAQEIELSESVWHAMEYAANTWQWIRVLINNKNRKLRSVSDGKWSFPIEWRYTYMEKHFSSLPYLGVGSDTSVYTDGLVCGLVANLVSSQTNFGGGIIGIGVSWDAATGADSYQWEFKESGATDWIVNNSVPPTNAWFGAPGKTYVWRVKTLCGGGEESAYVNGTNIVT